MKAIYGAIILAAAAVFSLSFAGTAGAEAQGDCEKVVCQIVDGEEQCKTVAIPCPEVSDVEIPNVNAACLPRRTQRDDGHPCHCPPESYCPTDTQWDTAFNPGPENIDEDALFDLADAISECNVTTGEGCTDKLTLRDLQDVILDIGANITVTQALRCCETPCGPDIMPYCVVTNESGLSDAMVRCACDPCEADPDLPECQAEDSPDSSDSSDGHTLSGDGDQCFTSGSEVIMANGSLLPIESIRVGDLVKGKTGINKVVDIKTTRQKGGVELYSINGSTSFVTGGHPILTKDGWRTLDGERGRRGYPKLGVKQLSLGDEIVTFSGSIKVRSLEQLTMMTETITHSLIVDGDRTYYSDGNLVLDNSAEDYTNDFVETDATQ